MGKRIFITGMSGVGKSTVIEALRLRGFSAIDTDYDDWCEFAILEGQSEWMWREDRMFELLNAPSTAALFVAGCCANQRKFTRFFDTKILFSAPLEVMLERIAARTTNPYGKNDEDRAAIRQNFMQIQPLLRQSADIEIDTTALSVPEITDFLVELASK